MNHLHDPVDFNKVNLSKFSSVLCPVTALKALIDYKAWMDIRCVIST